MTLALVFAFNIAFMCSFVKQIPHPPFSLACNVAKSVQWENAFVVACNVAKMCNCIWIMVRFVYLKLCEPSDSRKTRIILIVYHLVSSIPTFPLFVCGEGNSAIFLYNILIVSNGLCRLAIQLLCLWGIEMTTKCLKAILGEMIIINLNMK